ncbi:MAG: SatD family protein [Dehalococcoidia bacterium]|nr:SatD family protein [Dehalococcoidia bacterium]
MPATLIADVVGSRKHGAGAELFLQLQPILDKVNERTSPLQPLTFTIGDEIQGIYDSVASAIRASLLIHLLTAPVELRVGIGFGDVLQTSVSVRPFGQTGEGWWLARDALTFVEREQSPKLLRTIRTAIRHSDATIEQALNGWLVLRDHLLSRMDATDRSITTDLLEDTPQFRIAESLAVDPAAISRRVQRSGARQIVWAQLELERAV